MTLIVNLFAGPGSGKSTTAAGVFYQLKQAGVNCELVQEYAKELVWSEDWTKLENQFYVSAKQNIRIKRLLGKVDVIITDSPILIGCAYMDDVPDNDNLKTFIKETFLEESEFSYNFFIERTKAYNPKGRVQTLEEAKECDEEIRTLVSEVSGLYISIKGDHTAAENISRIILEELNET